MSGMFFHGLDLAEVNYHLAVGSGSHGQQTGEMLRTTEEVLFILPPTLFSRKLAYF
jgi:UDP-GlcNAc3NAcA epimerase